NFIKNPFGSRVAGAWGSAQGGVSGNPARPPYLATGVFPRGLRPMRGDIPAYVVRCLSQSLRQWMAYLANAGSGTGRSKKSVESIIRYHERELERSRRRWPHVFAK